MLKSHNRTTGGIDARRKVIAYKLYKNDKYYGSRSSKTKLDEDQIIDIINKNQKSKSRDGCNDLNKSTKMKMQIFNRK